MANNPVILVVDDEIAIQRLLRIGLVRERFKLVEARTAAAALKRLAEEKFDLVILDIGLPDRDGFEVLNSIRESSSVPVVMLSVRASEEEKVKAFDLGADDYITKPFGMAELVARLKLAIRHRYQTSGADPVIHVGDVEINLVSHRVTRAGEEVRLSKTEYSVLKLLAEHEGKVLTHDFILREIRGDQPESDPQYLRVYMRALRRKLGDTFGSNRIIRTETGVGYRLVADKKPSNPA